VEDGEDPQDVASSGVAAKAKAATAAIIVFRIFSFLLFRGTFGRADVLLPLCGSGARVAHGTAPKVVRLSIHQAGIGLPFGSHAEIAGKPIELPLGGY
jgi:hypothetical protein